MLLQLNYDTRLAAKRRVLIEAKFVARLTVSDDGELDKAVSILACADRLWFGPTLSTARGWVLGDVVVSLVSDTGSPLNDVDLKSLLFISGGDRLIEHPVLDCNMSLGGAKAETDAVRKIVCPRTTEGRFSSIESVDKTT